MPQVFLWLLLDVMAIITAGTIVYGAKIRRDRDEIRRGKRLMAIGIMTGLVALFVLQYALESDAGTEMMHGFQIVGLFLNGIGIAAFVQYRDDPFPTYQVFAWVILILFTLGGLGLTVGLRLIGQPLTV